ncbi:sensor histidine kinase [Bacillus taeanensis]|uniref:histidine kinase n=1 Tax=Bacillus taeanensis TaxID=273032 RepID=A0A366XSK0_9BACI|nr:sensor histidine kinase [Bacillus taeanensis]RBW69112.1 sensor histidine kinase [Bacillus taeanensis]
MFKNNIRNKLILLLLLVTILPFGSSIILTYMYTKESLKDQAIQENINLLYQGKSNFQTYLEDIHGLALSIYSQPKFMNFLRSPSQENDYVTMGTVKNFMQTLLYVEESVERVYMHIVKQNKSFYVSKTSTMVFEKKENMKNQKIYNEIKSNPSHLYIEPLHFQGSYDPLENNTVPKQVFTVHRAIINIPSDEIIGYMSIDVLPEKVFELSENLFNKETEEFYILTPDGDIFYNSHKNASNPETNQEWISKLLAASTENGALEWQDNTFNGVMIYDRIAPSQGGWVIVKRIPYTTLYESAFNVTKMNILIGVFVLILVIFATLFVSFKITSPIRILVKNIQEIEEGNMKVQFKSLGNDEIGVLGERFKRMIEKINHLINREYKLEIENKTNQLKVLQSQINPHFLYNTLQSIGTIALKNKVPQIYTLITHLSQIMRYGMNMQEDMVPLTKEINHSKSYYLLQKERFTDSLDYTIDVDEDVMQILVPKMILQPLIENYFQHGFDIRQEIGKIEMRGRKINNFLLIKICDNGTGIQEERLEEIRLHLETGKRRNEAERESIGLKNVHDRLKLYYGESASLNFSNRESGGLCVIIKIPINEKGGEL